MTAVPGIKFCGLTRPSDAAYAAALGASYVGVIFAESVRKVDVATARAVYEGAGGGVGHVAVFSHSSAAEIASHASEAGADVVQLHDARSRKEIDDLRDHFSGEIWALISVHPNDTSLPPNYRELSDAADAVLLDARVEGRSGGTGKTLDWHGLAESLARVRHTGRLILAGGLNPENVGVAVRSLAPSIVDVSSGVEISPGIKDPKKMKAFAEAVRAASIVDGRSTSPSRLDTE